MTWPMEAPAKVIWDTKGLSAVMWCRACGHDGGETGFPCAACGVPLLPPDPGPAQVGVVVKLAGGLFTKLGVAVAAADGMVDVLAKGDTVTRMADSEFAALEVVPVAGPVLWTAPGRLMFVHRSVESGQMRAKWTNAHVASAAVALADADVKSRRAAVPDWLWLGLVDHVGSLDLSATEIVWSQALIAARRGEVGAAVEALERLPSQRYSHKVDVVLALADQVLADDQLAGRAGRLVEPFANENPVARVLLAALDRGGSHLDQLRAAKELLSTSSAIDDAVREEMARLIEGVAGDKAERPKDPETYAATQALAVYRTGIDGGSVDQDAGWLLPARLSLYDDLIDRGVLSPAGIKALKLKNDPLKYVTARLNPSDLALTDLEGLGHTAELARRLYLDGNAARLSELPAADPLVAHYSALLAIRTGGDASREHLRPEVREVLEEVDLYRRDIQEAMDASPSERILNDPSCWRLLYKEALAGRIRLSAHHRAQWAQFAAWIDLCEIQSCVFARDWTAVGDLSGRLLARVEDERVRDEIENMAAYAQYQLGNHRAAMDMLNLALTGRHSEALVVNASVVASELGSEFASTFLARVYEEAADPLVGTQALMKAINLWLSDDSSQEAPGAIVASIRTALLRLMSDDVLRTFINFSAHHDTEWLAALPPIGTNSQSQTDIVRYYQILARNLSPSRKEDLSDVAGELATIHRRRPVPEWATEELARIVDMLMDAVHVDFGTAPGLSGPIEELMNADLLTLAQRLVLGPQAGAHLAAFYDEHFEQQQATLSAQAEQRFLWAPLELYLKEQANIPDGSREWVGGELIRCLIVANFAIVSCTEKQMAEFGPAWDALVARERWDQQNRSAILRQERVLLDQISEWLKRCNNYDRQLCRLPLDTEAKKKVNACRDQVNGWTNEIARLRSMV